MMNSPKIGLSSLYFHLFEKQYYKLFKSELRINIKTMVIIID